MIVTCPSCRIPAMTSTLFAASVCFLMLMDLQLVLGTTDRVIAEEISNTSNGCWQEVESILLNSSRQYTACV